MMNTIEEWLTLVPVFAGGALLGFIFFGGLYLTVQNSLSARNPGAWFLLSMVVRTAIVVGGFYLLGQGEVARFVACLLGFVLVRVLLTNRLKNVRETVITKERRHDQS